MSESNKTIGWHFSMRISIYHSCKLLKYMFMAMIADLIVTCITMTAVVLKRESFGLLLVDFDFNII